MKEAGVEKLVIVPIVDGMAQSEVVHLPRRVISRDESPYRMVAACGTSGVVYARSGLFSGSQTCDRCEQILSGCGRYASLVRYNAGCRCQDCKLAMARYRSALYRRNGGGANRTCPDCGGVKAPGGRTCMRCYLQRRACCGTNSMYARGCRCENCRDAHRVYMRAWHERRRAAA